MTEVQTGEQPLARFQPIEGLDDLVRQATRFAEATCLRLAGRKVWNINSTPAGGGVAELLRALLPYVRSAGIDARWAVIRGRPDFFRLTKRIHHALHNSPGDGSPLGEKEQVIYRAVMDDNVPGVCGAVQPRDIVILHDPQTAGLAPELIRRGALVIWRCHIGFGDSTPEVERGWAFLYPYLRDVPAFVFTRAAYVPAYCDHGKTTVITPSIDAFSPKNQNLDEATVRSILVAADMVRGPAGDAPPVFTSEDGTQGRVESRAEVTRVGGAPAWKVPQVVQISRWDPLKDPVGVLRGFAELASGGGAAGAELVLAGPDVSLVADDPEGQGVFAAVVAAWRELPEAVRRRVHLVLLPMDDVQENAAIVNALQRHAAIVVQKSLHEGFGLTVTEAMWKARPVVASAVGGIQDQIEDGVHGLLLADPTDRVAFAGAVRRLLEDPALARRLGEAARERVREKFLGLHHLVKYARLLEKLDAAFEAAGRPRQFVGKAGKPAADQLC